MLTEQNRSAGARSLFAPSRANELAEKHAVLLAGARKAFAILDGMGCTKNSPIRDAWKALEAAIISGA